MEYQNKHQKELEFLGSIDPKTIKLEDMKQILTTIETVRKTVQETINNQEKKVKQAAETLANRAIKLDAKEWYELLSLVELFCGSSRLQQKDMKNNFTENFKNTLAKLGLLEIGYEFGDNFLNINYDNYLTQIEMQWSVQAGKNSGKEFKQDDLKDLQKIDDLLAAIEKKKQTLATPTPETTTIPNSKKN